VAPTSDVVEATLDVETVAALAPGANIVLWVMPALSTLYFNDALAEIQQDGRASIITFSAAACENSSTSVPTSGIISTIAPTIATIAAAGDQGSACFVGSNTGGQKTYRTGVSYPASDPNVIAVGGTETSGQTAQLGLTSQTAWNDTLSNGSAQEAGGGGVSTIFPLPTFQAGITGLASPSFRNVPDVAMPAVYDGIYENGSWQDVNGTSWGAPQFAAMLAEIYQYCGVTSLPNPASIPYAALNRAQYGAFIDVLNGNNAFSLVTGSTPAYSAAPGFDNVSGIGVPLGMPFAASICPNHVPLGRLRSSSVPALSVARTMTQAYAMDVTPKIFGLSDLGRRATTASTRIQLIISPAGSRATNEAAAASVLSAAGFTVAARFANHLVLDATGPSSAIESLFSTEMHDVAQGTIATEYMPSKSIIVPASLAPYVSGVVLDNVVTFAHQ
jgi:subtilase family serine protease